jgi:choline kinase
VDLSIESANAKETLAIAGYHLDRLDHPSAVRVLTNFLRKSSTSKILGNRHASISINSLVICLACGGSGKRWGNFLNTKKHLVDIGGEVALLEHTKNQLLNRITPSRLIAVVNKHERDYYKFMDKIELINRVGDPQEDVALEILGNPSIGLDATKNLLLLMGDVAFSESAFDQIVEVVGSSTNLILFGRSKKNDFYNNTGGEIFGAYVPGTELTNIGGFYEICKKIYYGTTTVGFSRYSTWEVLALITAAGKKSGESTLAEIGRHQYSLREILPIMKSSLEQGEFLESIWHEIDDETEDFDFPFEYLRWLSTQVEQRI